MQILLVEDESKVARFIRQGLEAEGYQVEIASDGAAGEMKGKTGSFDLILLDVLLPEKDGFQVLQSLRKGGVRTPVLMLTARSDTPSIVQGLDLGADDYLSKPFVFRELLARVRSLLRRENRSQILLKMADLQLNTVTHKATRNGFPIELTSREYEVLEFLLRHPATLLTRRQLAKDIWGFDFDPGTNIVDVYMSHLRKKIDYGFKKQLLHTERGKGYFLSEKASLPKLK